MTEQTDRPAGADATRAGNEPARVAGLPMHLAAAFFASGAAALIYELLWFRLLGHVFGSTATATATLLAAYLFGLGLGAWLFGRWSDRIVSHPRAYIAIELGIGLYGVLSRVLLERGAALYSLGHAWAGDDAGKLLFTRFVVSFVLIAVPTTLMGGTFPLMVQLLKSRASSLGRATGEAYAANTAGAAAGTIALPFLLLPALGVTRSLILAAIANFTAAALVFEHVRNQRAADRDTAAGGMENADGDATPAEPGTPQPRREARAARPPTRRAPVHAPLGARARRLLLTGFFLSSFASLALETVWARHFGIFFGAQIYNFAFILFAYLLGLFGGGAIFARYVDRGVAPGRLLYAGLTLAGVPVALTLPFLDQLPVPQIRMMLAMGISHSTFLMTTAIETIALILPTAIGFGIVFPAIVDLVSDARGRAGASVALTYVVNTAGTTAGAIGAGFVLIPAVGTQRTIEISALLIAAALVLSGLAAWAPRGLLARWGVPALLALTILLPGWNWRLAHGTYAKDPLTFLNAWREGSVTRQLADQKILYLNEGVEATVAVAQFDTTGHNTLFINGKPDASSYPADMVIQRLLAVAPGLFHDHPRDALVIGLGSGTTLATLMRWPVESIDAAEISPEVAEAATRYFGDVNEAFLSDPRVKLRLEDGRNFLHFQPEAKYDVIISAPSNPWLAGVSALFTDEFFAEAASRLKPGGLICQWSGYYNLSMDHIRMVVRTFQRHFPETVIFVARGDSPTGDFLLVGSKEPLRLRMRPDDARVPPAVRAALADVRNDGPADFLGGLVVSPENVAAFAGGGPVNSDERPLLELEAPGDRFHPWLMENLVGFLTAAPRNYLPMDPPPSAAPMPGELARDGFATRQGAIPEGAEVRRGVFVFTAPAKPGEEEIRRYVFQGREIEQGGRLTSLLQSVVIPGGPAEVLDMSAAVAGATPGALRDVEVNGHRAVAVLAESGTTRIAVVGWFCDRLGRAYFTSMRGTPESLPSATETITTLAVAHACDHEGIAAREVDAETARTGAAPPMLPWTAGGGPPTSGSPGSSGAR